VQATGTGGSFTLCYTDGCFTVSVTDGSVPMNGTFIATMDGLEVASGAINNGQLDLTLGTPVQGCTDPAALNYDPNAVCNDGSCCTEGLVLVSVLTEAQGLTGTVDVTVTMGGSLVHEGPLPIMALPGLGVAGAQLSFCQASGCLSVTVGNSTVPLGGTSLVDHLDAQGLQRQFFLPEEGFFGPLGEPAPELCDGLDNDCDGTVDEDFFWYPDADGDGWGANVTAVVSCTPVAGSVQQSGDCDDANDQINPGMPDGCDSADGIDNNCNGQVEDDAGIWFADADGDGWGDAGAFIPACVQPPGTSPVPGDCDDANDAVFPGAAEICDGLDNDCDGAVDEDFLWYADADGDGFGDDATAQISCTLIPDRVQVGGDCNDADPNLTVIGATCNDGDPNTENDIVRADCSCLGFAPGECPPGEITDCNGNCAPAEWVGDGFCDDGSFEYNGNAIFFNCAEFSNDGGDCGGGGCVTEVCDGVDNDCDGLVDEGFALTYYEDADGDGLGNTATAIFTCQPPAGFVQVGGDCDDEDPTVQQGFTLLILTEDPGDFGTAHYVIQHNGGFLEGDLDLPLETEGVGELPACIATGCFTISIGQNDVPLYQQAYLLFPATQQDPVVFPTLDAYQGGISLEVCDGIDNDCDGVVDEGCSVNLSVRVHLGGPYDPDTGLMGDGLRALGLVPTTEPYTGLGYAHTGGGGETTTAPVLAASGSDAIVDWVVIELRDAVEPALVVVSRCALLQRDGDVVDVDGQSPLELAVPSGNYFVAVRHRNHLPAMTLTSVALASGLTMVDLTASTTLTYGIEARRSIAGTFPTRALWAGDINFDTQVMYTGSDNDRDPILQRIGGAVPTNIVGGYLPEDVNLNGQVQYTGSSNDRDPILITIGGSVPTSVRQGQLP